MNKTGLILLAHGSNNPDWQVPFQNLAADLASSSSDHILIRSAFLQLAPPSLPEAIHALAADGIRKITILPMFMAAGNHIREDIPNEVDAILENFPELKIELLPTIGNHPRFKSMLRDIVEELM